MGKELLLPGLTSLVVAVVAIWGQNWLSKKNRELDSKSLTAAQELALQDRFYKNLMAELDREREAREALSQEVAKLRALLQEKDLQVQELSNQVARFKEILAHIDPQADPNALCKWFNTERCPYNYLGTPGDGK